MLAEYIAHRVETITERTYNKLVLILATTSMTSIALSGLGLVFAYAFKYLALSVAILGILAARITLRKAEEKIAKLLNMPEKTPEAKLHFAILKDSYDPYALLKAIYQEPRIEDPLVRKEKKAVEASRPMLASRYRALITRTKTIITATIMAVAIPHLIINLDVTTAIIMMITIYTVRRL